MKVIKGSFSKLIDFGFDEYWRENDKKTKTFTPIYQSGYKIKQNKQFKQI